MSAESTVLAGRYVLESRIAAGGMASVWRARDQVLARPVAVKLLHPHLALDESFSERFRHEARAAARLSHPNIVAIFDTANDAGAATGDSQPPFIVMEYCAGGSLASVLTERGSLDPASVGAIGRQICEGLAYAHRNGIVHRDIKPANVLVADSTLKVGDFGIAKAAFTGADLTTTGSILGSTAYLSPEQVRGEEPDARADLYAVGVLLYELLVGAPPFRGANHMAVAMAHVHDEPVPLRSLRATVPRDLEVVVMRALSKDPGDRWQSAEDMAAALAGDAATTLERPAADPPDEMPGTGRHGSVVTRRGRREAAAQTRSLIPVAAVVGVAIILGFLLPPLLENGVDAFRAISRGSSNRGSGPNRLEIAQATDFDPLGDNEEHSEDVAAAWDGRSDTSWTTESYRGGLGKPGVGLLFDLGRSREVQSVRVASDTPGTAVELRAAETLPEGGVAGTELVVERTIASERIRLDAGGHAARYWLIWIIQLPSAGVAHVSEVAFLGA